MTKIKALAREAWARIKRLKNERPGLFWWAVSFLAFLVILVALDLAAEWLAAPFAALGSKTVRRAAPASKAADRALEKIRESEAEADEFRESLSEAREAARTASEQASVDAQDSKEPWL